ncbi:DNA primase large subunit isoform X2 [Fopius arisanus]|uniref:DNA primase large subunit isoform X2 n=1 Tax=Fopius arisanus TaxID=64838 RepID=A0A9R1STE8_9HYME|nr:PREDICTED: DNA primase large subunit-like isoform X2 [Fopius arisanus]
MSSGEGDSDDTTKNDYDENSVEIREYNPVLLTYALPDVEVNLEYVEKLVYDRIIVLLCVRTINRWKSSSPLAKRKKLITLIEKHKLSHYIWLLTNNGVDPGTEEHRNHVLDEQLAHLFIHVVFNYSDVILDMLQVQEQALFEWQVLTYEIPQALEFIEKNGHKFLEATPQEVEDLRYELDIHHCGDNPRDPSETIYKVPWNKAPISDQDIVLHHGFCYIRASEIKRVLPSLYYSHMLNARNNDIYEIVDNTALDEDQTIILRSSLVMALERKHLSTNRLKFNMDKIASEIWMFPPCFRLIHDHLNDVHHLKHFSRMQYYDILHGVNADCAKVERYMYSQFVEQGRVPLKKYGSYKYFIEHRFGKRGSCIEYSTPDCRVYAQTVKNQGECNGCPFSKNSAIDIEELGAKLTEWNCPDDDKQQILQYKVAGNCNRACETFFKGLHGVEPTSKIINPLNFFSESLAFRKEDNNDEESEEDFAEIFDELFKELPERHELILNEEWRMTIIEKKTGFDLKLPDEDSDYEDFDCLVGRSSSLCRDDNVIVN